MSNPDERCFLMDLIHGLAVFDGTRSAMDEKREKVLRRCIIITEDEDPAKFLVVVPESELDAHAIAYMESTRRIPKRVVMEMESKCGTKIPSCPSASSLPRL